ncbi:hypothetical protein F511_04716 [Dorcoceras hygrometricum]|uniref:Uncharacterized protein n=1 Tax=Dorcoceras hygrometricum TaxID=472368 RepID=A0A2Z7B0K5_9LAMI|nr:hypothetical protein F511_04716 [Dorcoceras hygrometricum]
MCHMSLKLFLCFILLSSTAGRSEARIITRKSTIVSQSFRAMFQRKMVLDKYHDIDGGDNVSSLHKPSRASPGGPDPQHHFINVPMH